MTVSRKRTGLVLLVALSTWARSDQLVGQEPRSPISVLLAFVREDVRIAVPPEMRPYEIGRVFLRVHPGVSGRDALGSLDQRNLEPLGVTLVDDKAEVLLVDERGSHVRDDGVYVSISSVDRVDDMDPRVLAITFSYYVTFRRPGRRPVICLQEWRIVQRPADAGDAGWEIVEAKNFGKC